MRWFFLVWAVVLLLVLMLTPAECSAGILEFFAPRVTTPVNVTPVNSDIIGGMKATITLGSIGSVITSHLALIIFGVLLYCAICRLGDGYHARVIGWRGRRSAERVERLRLWNDRRANWRSTLFSILHPSVAKRRAKQDARGNVMTFDVNVQGLEELNAAITRMEEAQRMAAEMAKKRTEPRRGDIDRGTRA